ncbi:hypothetical protein INT46_001568 [Mucor plumbeus]|uniref:Uncharacterized protein n=1 Tax=Mucor plumbeus TaxID=97098 RepID=A0A8H7V5A4_9FUNG|nr:hypothetical protein INT46_001568 [Mucor plumbeus]
MIICREQAVCIFYCKEFNEENTTICSKKIEDIGDVDICYLVDPTDPVLVLDIKINPLSFKFHCYISNQEESNPKIPSQEEIQEKERVQLIVRNNASAELEVAEEQRTAANTGNYRNGIDDSDNDSTSSNMIDE